MIDTSRSNTPADRFHLQGAAWHRAAKGVRAIVHTAAIVASKSPKEEFFAVNVGGTGQAIAAAREAGVRLVHVSSVAVYGRTKAYTARAGAVDEEFPFGEIQPHDFYAQSNPPKLDFGIGYRWHPTQSCLIVGTRKE